MTLDEILTQYEDLWRKAALENAKQMNVDQDAPGPWRYCAWLAAEAFGMDGLVEHARCMRVRWKGSESILSSDRSHDLSGVMAYVNNNHRWSWLDFANKFRDCVEEVPNE